MKSTGMFRRVDELGRIVLPKELRTRLEIEEGDPLEIFLEEITSFFRNISLPAPSVRAVIISFIFRASAFALPALPRSRNSFNFFGIRRNL